MPPKRDPDAPRKPRAKRTPKPKVSFAPPVEVIDVDAEPTDVDDTVTEATQPASEYTGPTDEEIFYDQTEERGPVIGETYDRYDEGDNIVLTDAVLGPNPTHLSPRPSVERDDDEGQGDRSESQLERSLSSVPLMMFQYQLKQAELMAEDDETLRNDVRDLLHGRLELGEEANTPAVWMMIVCYVIASNGHYYVRWVNDQHTHTVHLYVFEMNAEDRGTPREALHLEHHYGPAVAFDSLWRSSEMIGMIEGLIANYYSGQNLGGGETPYGEAPMFMGNVIEESAFGPYKDYKPPKPKPKYRLPPVKEPVLDFDNITMEELEWLLKKHKLSVKNRFFGMMMKMQEKIDQLEARISVGDVLTAKQAEELERLREELALAMHRMVENDIRWREAQEVQRIKNAAHRKPKKDPRGVPKARLGPEDEPDLSVVTAQGRHKRGVRLDRENPGRQKNPLRVYSRDVSPAASRGHMSERSKSRSTMRVGSQTTHGSVSDAASALLREMDAMSTQDTESYHDDMDSYDDDW